MNNVGPCKGVFRVLWVFFGISHHIAGFFNRFLLCSQNDVGEEELCSIYVPTNHLYIGDIFLVNSKDVIRPNLSVREGIGILSLWSHLLSSVSFLWVSFVFLFCEICSILLLSIPVWFSICFYPVALADFGIIKSVV